MPLAQVLPHPQLIFPSKTWFLGIYLNFQQQKSLKNQYLPHSESKSYQLHSIKSCSSRSFQQQQRHIPIPLKISVKKNHSTFNNFWTTRPNVMEPSPCTPPPWELSKETKNAFWSIPGSVDLISTNKTKQTNKLPSFIDRWGGLLSRASHDSRAVTPRAVASRCRLEN